MKKFLFIRTTQFQALLTIEYMPKPRLSGRLYRDFLFWIGVIATFSYRIIVILNYYSQLWVEIAWYVGTIGFIWYFAHRYRVENKRDTLIENKNLADKIKRRKELTNDDRDALVYILKGVETSKAKWNYIVIFAFSIIALIYATYNNITRWLF